MLRHSSDLNIAKDSVEQGDRGGQIAGVLLRYRT